MITFDRYAIHVEDMEKSLAFYDAALGLRASSRGEGTAELSDGVTMFRLTLLAGSGNEAKPGGGYLTFLADEPKALKARHAAMGCLCPEDGGDGWFIKDPDGYRILVLPAPLPGETK